MPEKKVPNNELTLFDNILYGNLAPWLDKNKPDERFVAKLNEIKKVKPLFPHQYEIEFYRPFNAKTQYYHKLILDESIAYCNKIYQLVKEDDNLKLLKYWRNDTLEKKLPSKLKDLGKLIKDRQYAHHYFDPKKMSFDIDADHKTEAFIMQLLKVVFIRVYLEIQNLFPFIPNEELLIEEDLYTRFLFEPVSEVSFLKEKRPVIKVKPEASETVDNSEEMEDVSIYSFTYKQFDTSPDKLNDFCDSLKKYKFISKETTLSNFKKVFSGNPISTPIVWTGNPTEFSYLIKLLHNQLELVENLKQKQWKIACDCFIKEDGTAFEPSKVRKLQKPSTAQLIEKATKLLI